MHIKGVLLALALTAPATLAILPPTAHAADGTLYEVSEAIDLKSNGKGFKSSEATLSGTIKIEGAFQGVFRIPFMNGQQASYLQDDGRVVPLAFTEYSVGQPTPRLELTFTSTK